MGCGSISRHMKQVVRRVIDRKGRVQVVELPEPAPGPHEVLIENAFSLISTGTELGTLSKTPLELVRQTLTDPWMRHVVKATIFSSGIPQTMRRVWQEMTTFREIGYSGAGRVLAIGAEVEGLRVGETVAYASAGHAEQVTPCLNHVVPVPAEVPLEHAAFVTVGGIAIHALRRAEPQFGEIVAIQGLGLVGQLALVAARSAGLVTIGIDVHPGRLELARSLGTDLVVDARDPDWKRTILGFTEKHGPDATLICARSDSSEIVNSALEITRKQGRVVIVGYVGLDIHPKNFLYREIDLRYSRAYGPGSYHSAYEKGRTDYPYEYLRWTEKRNLGEFIRMLGAGKVPMEKLIGGVYDIEKAQEAFDALVSGTFPGVAALLRHGSARSRPVAPPPTPRAPAREGSNLGIALVGCGNHALAVHLPNIRRIEGMDLKLVVSRTGRNSGLVTEQFPKARTSSSFDTVREEPGVDAVLISSPHGEHFEHVRASLEAGKAVFVEKPLVMKFEELRALDRLVAAGAPPLTVGLNRRYSRRLLDARGAARGRVLSVDYQVVVPPIPPDHWTLDPHRGGGRLIAEGEHFVDLCNFLIGAPPERVWARALGSAPEHPEQLTRFSVVIEYAGAVAHIVFQETPVKELPRERITLRSQENIVELDDFNHLRVHGARARSDSAGRSAMGHEECLREFHGLARGKPSSCPSWAELRDVSLTLFAALESIRTGEVISLTEMRAALLEDAPAAATGVSV